MSVVAGTEVEWDLDLNATIPCQNPDHGDTRPEAHWRVTRPCCHLAHNTCDDCLRLILDRAARAARSTTARCRGCGADFRPPEWRRL